MDTLDTFLYGALAALGSVAAFFFLRYWRSSGDRFFIFVSISFFGLAAHWASLAGPIGEEHAAYYYLPRLGAFVILLVGIIDKNRRGSSEDAKRETNTSTSVQG